MIPQFLQKHFLLAIVLIVVVSRLPSLGSSVLDIDESDFAVQTAVWMNGGVPYVDFVEKKTPIIHSYYMAVFSVFGLYNTAAVHIADMAVVLLTIAGVYVFARYAAGEKTARWAALLYAFFQGFYDLNDYLSTTTESLMNLFAVYAAFVFFKSMREDKPGMSLFAGVLICLSALAKQVGLAILPACLISMVWFWREQKEHPWHRYIEESLLLLMGFAFPIILLTGYLSDVGGLDGFVKWTWSENLSYAAAKVGFWAFVKRALSQGGKYFVASWALWALSASAAYHYLKKRQIRVEIVFLLAWIVFIFPAVSLGGRFFAHYFLQFMPPLTVLAAIGMVAFVEDRLKKFSRSTRRIFVTAGSAVVFVLPFVVFFILHIVQIGDVRAETGPIREIAEWIKTNTTKHDRIFVWGHDSDVYFFSQRLPASRFMYCSYLSGMKEGYESEASAKSVDPDVERWDMVRSDFSRHEPAVIVDLAPTNRRGYAAYPMESQTFLGDYVRDNYSLGATVVDAKIYVRNEP